MKAHFMLAALVVVLAAILFLLMYSQKPAEFAATDTHEGETEHEEEPAVPQKSQAPQEAAQAVTIPTATGPRTLVRLDTGMGPIEVILFDDLAPKTVKNFLDLTNKGFYKNMIFHRVIKGFMNQTGDPKGDGTGGAGYEFADEIVPALKHNQPGVVAMANHGPNTNSSQFYITATPQPQLDGSYTVFGQVVKGIDVVNAINAVPTDRNDKPLRSVALTSVTVLGQQAPPAK